MLCTIEILSIGNELLTGKTANTNATWLAKHITSLGGFVTRITTVRDNLKVIETSISEILRRNPTLLLTSGGLGPTFDDMTLQALANSIDQPLRVDKTALQMIKTKYRSLMHKKTLPLTKARIKMATLPKGAQALPNPVGTAPGVLIQIGASTIICLPGVPSELQQIFETSISHLISDNSDGFRRVSRSLHVSGIFESAMAPLVDRVMRKNPGVYIKSHPGGREKRGRSRIELEFSIESSNRPDAEERIKSAIDEMTDILTAKRKMK